MRALVRCDEQPRGPVAPDACDAPVRSGGTAYTYDDASELTGKNGSKAQGSSGQAGL